MIEDYTPPEPAVEEVDGDRLRIFCGDDVPPIGAAIAIDTKTDDTKSERFYAVVRRHAGTRRVDAWLPNRPNGVEVGCPIEPTASPATFEVPDNRHITPGPQLIRPGSDVELWPSPPEWSELAGQHSPLTIDIDPVDTLAPLCEGGLNLVIDLSDQCNSFFHIARRARAHLNAETTLFAGRRRNPESIGADGWFVEADESPRTQIASLQLTIALASRLRESSSSLAVVQLPDLQTSPAQPPHRSSRTIRRDIADVVQRLGEHLVSTTDAELTSLLLLTPPADDPGLATIIDNLRLGDVDTTIFIDESGRFQPGRSSSGADLDEPRRQRRREYLKVLDTARRAGEKSSIFGDVELTDVEREALEEADRLHAQI